MIAKLNEQEGVCLDGKWRGWLFRQHIDGQWVSVRKLDEVDTIKLGPHAVLFQAFLNPTPEPKQGGISE